MHPVEHSLGLETKWRVVQLGVVRRLALGVTEYQIFCMQFLRAESLLLVVLSWNNRCSKKGQQHTAWRPVIFQSEAEKERGHKVG